MIIHPKSSQECHVCGGPLNPVRSYRGGQNKKSPFHGLFLGRCAECSLVQATPLPRPEELSVYYGGNSAADRFAPRGWADPPAFPPGHPFGKAHGRVLADLILSHVDRASTRRVLDVGAGYGHTLEVLHERLDQAELHALEPTPRYVDSLRGRNFSVDARPFESWEPDGRYDVVIASHILEHVRRPQQLLERLEESVRPGGVLCIETAHLSLDWVDRPVAHPWRPRWDEPQLSFFSSRSLRYLINRTGLAIESLTACGPAFRPISRLRFRLPPLESILPPRLVFHNHWLSGRFWQPRLQETLAREANDGIWLRAVLRRPLRVRVERSLHKEWPFQRAGATP